MPEQHRERWFLALEPALRCSVCGFGNPLNFRYCGSCGAPLEGGLARAATKLIAERNDANSDQALVDRAISQLSK